MMLRMLQHLYMQTYDVDLGHDPLWCMNDSWATTRLHVHAQMYSVGDKYDLPSLKKEAARRFGEDVRIPGHSKRETLTLLSVVQTVYQTTPDSDRGLRDLVVQHIFPRYGKASNHFIEELDNALGVRQFARDIIVLHRKRAPIDYNTIAQEAYRIWHRHVTWLRAATISSFRNIAHLHARLHARISAAGWTTGEIICFLVLTLVFIGLLKTHPLFKPYLEFISGHRPTRATRSQDFLEYQGETCIKKSGIYGDINWTERFCIAIGAKGIQDFLDFQCEIWTETSGYSENQRWTDWTCVQS